MLDILVDTDALEATLRDYELNLLDALGLLPDLSRSDLAGEPLILSADYQFDPVAGVATRSGAAARSPSVPDCCSSWSTRVVLP